MYNGAFISGVSYFPEICLFTCMQMYNEELAGIAQAYSLNCQFGHSSTVSSPSFSFIGENIFLAENVVVNYTSFIVDSWADAESRYYDYATNTCNPPPTGGACGHYTQVSVLLWLASN